MRVSSILALGGMREESSIEPLIEILVKDCNETKACAAFSLGEIGNEKAVEPLSIALKTDKYGNVKECSAISLGKIGDQRAVDPLIMALNENDSVKSCAALALGKIGNPKAVKP
ncbi:HEAT repeat domain-containing protein [Methanosarcina barkeri]|uniref:HEAT repeat domain-containing protein n=1 Tax=Methanosarcina barkeri TaxID=2208 RepID=UPI0006CFDF25|nr:HEAT repeat domain-containing protein [Methanosarcina barkeri]